MRRWDWNGSLTLGAYSPANDWRDNALDKLHDIDGQGFIEILKAKMHERRIDDKCTRGASTTSVSLFSQGTAAHSVPASLG